MSQPTAVILKHPKTNLPILTSENYRVWSKAMVRHFDGLGFLEYVFPPPARGFAYDQSINAKVTSSLAEHADDSIVNEFFDQPKAHLIWSQLESVFGPTNTTMGILAGTRLSRRRWVQGQNPKLFLTNVDSDISDMSMLPIQHQHWRDFRKFVSPKTTTWIEAKNTFLEWASQEDPVPDSETHSVLVVSDSSRPSILTPTPGENPALIKYADDMLHLFGM